MKTEAVTTSDPLRAQALAALNKAAMAISRDLELDQTLQHIVDSARELVSASYAALGVFNSEGELETFVFSGLSPQEADDIGAFPEGLGLLGAVLNSPHPIRVADIHKDKRSQGIPDGHPIVTNFLGCPFLHQMRSRGTCI